MREHDESESADDRSVERGATRRSVIGTVAAAGLAGCLGSSGGGSTATPEAESDGQTTATPTETGWGDLGDAYYEGLVSDFEGMGLPEGEFVFGNSEVDGMGGFTLASDVASGSALTVDDALPFALARRVVVPEATENPWDVNFYGRVTDRAVSEGDVLLGVFYLRGVEGSETEPTGQFSSKKEDNLNTNMVRMAPKVRPPAEWTRYYVPVEFTMDAAADAWWFELYLGFGPQTIDIGGAALVDFGGDVSVEDLSSGPVGVSRSTASPTTGESADDTATDPASREPTATGTDDTVDDLPRR